MNKKEDAIDEIDNLIESYLVKISENDLSKEQAKRVAALIHAISDIERVSDHANNIAELAEKEIKEELIFSKVAIFELKKYFSKTKTAFSKSIKVLKTENPKIAKEVVAIEKETDALLEQFEYNHFKRVEKGECDSISGIVYVEVLRNLERVADHSKNISKIALLGF